MFKIIIIIYIFCMKIILVRFFVFWQATRARRSPATTAPAPPGRRGRRGPRVRRPAVRESGAARDVAKAARCLSHQTLQILCNYKYL
jgi:hypothetical protein